MSFLDKHWYRHKKSCLAHLLLPLSALFGLISLKRRQGYIKKQEQGKLLKIPVPVVIVGGICVGGSGKTPLCCALLKHLISLGYHPGLISRGYKGNAKHYPYEVTVNSDPAICGDEPLLIKQSLGEKAEVYVDPLRPRGAMALCGAGCDVIISDDGMQHYALERDLEILVVDAERCFGNQALMPSGPLREGIWRADTVDVIVFNGSKSKEHDGFEMHLKPSSPRLIKSTKALKSSDTATDVAHRTTPAPDNVAVPQSPERAPSSLKAGTEVTAMAGIGNPERFYKTVASLGFKIVDTILVEDHHVVSQDLLAKAASKRPVVMTAKDAVKYSEYGIDNLYVIEVEGCLVADFFATVDKLIHEAKDHPKRRSLRQRFSRKKLTKQV